MRAAMRRGSLSVCPLKARRSTARVWLPWARCKVFCFLDCDESKLEIFCFTRWIKPIVLSDAVLCVGLPCFTAGPLCYDEYEQKKRKKVWQKCVFNLSWLFENSPRRVQYHFFLRNTSRVFFVNEKKYSSWVFLPLRRKKRKWCFGRTLYTAAKE